MPNQFCPSCGKENPQWAGYCMSCGTVLSQSQPCTQPQYQQGEQLQHSSVGIASFVLGLCSAVGALVILAAHFGVWFTYVFDGRVVLFIALAACTLTAIPALVLGIIGVVQKGRRRLFAIFGTVLSAVSVAVVELAVNW